MKKKESQIISIQQIRDDPNSFVDGMARGKIYTVVRRSKMVATVGLKNSLPEKTVKPGSKEAVKKSIEIAKRIQRTHKPLLDPNKSYKELYYEGMAKKYGISGR